MKKTKVKTTPALDTPLTPDPSCYTEVFTADGERLLIHTGTGASGSYRVGSRIARADGVYDALIPDYQGSDDLDAHVRIKDGVITAAEACVGGSAYANRRDGESVISQWGTLNHPPSW